MTLSASNFKLEESLEPALRESDGCPAPIQGGMLVKDFQLKTKLALKRE